MKNYRFWLLILISTMLSCKGKKTKSSKGEKMENEFVSRIHISDFNTDVYQLLGKTSLEKHISDFENVKWKSDYKKEFSSMSFNLPDLEVMSKEDSKYLSISMAPDTEDTFQFVIGYGSHVETNDPNNPNRKVKLYMTESNNMEIPKKYINLFFKRNFERINLELKELYLMDEIEDVYKNKE